ncbi:alpha-glucan family phosphorylase [Citricoccus sp. SGAir0253]|uniref:alpha-glucan family phosphorylase n=1 Tax=Citricoccus sp. SGAir0253 TaxID=2567881 RepID=UPI001AF00688|nr:alpha-glucan family phosphorylase [Citricoccus sp. SGAir0253]
MKAIRRFTVRTHLPASIAGLGRLATNLRWSWHPETKRLFHDLDPAAWRRLDQDPVALLGSFDRARLAELAADESIVRRVAAATEDLDRYLTEDRWFQHESAGWEVPPRSIAYFSPEFGITAVLPQYSGGLGILAGDHLKSASDLGVPVIGVGLLYQSGYFKQSLSRDAWQQETYPVLDPDNLPLSLLKHRDGTPALVSLPLPGHRTLHAQVWRADVGRVPLLLLDSNVPANDDTARSVTDRLYGGGGEQRLQQELLLGMGGVRALRLFAELTGTEAPSVYHTNEGHAGFQGIERIEELMAAGLDWESALCSVRASTVFTTHTPVPAGIDRFDRSLVEQFFRAGLAPSVPVEEVLALGAEDYDGGHRGLHNMAVMGLRLGQRANGVARLHGQVSREMFRGLWPGFDADEVPITSITNGVHAPTWVSSTVSDRAIELFGTSAVAGPDWGRVWDVPDEELWEVRRTLRRALIADVRARLRSSWLKRGASEAEVAWTASVLDEDVLTIGFARRVPTYKRLTLMLRDPARLKRLLLDPEHPVQLVVAGKSHPADEQGKLMIQEMVRFADDPEVRHRIAFLPNYDIQMASTLMPGCDVWLNNPLRPLEACGTSGMKVAMNGGLNLSVLDGWWDEMFDGENGWAIPTASSAASTGERDDIEAAALYDLLESQVVPRFYGAERSDQAGAAGPSAASRDGLPHQWIAMVKHTMATLGPAMSADRMVQDYVTRLYRPAAAAGRVMDGDDFARARELAGWKTRVRSAFGRVAVEHVDSLGVSEEPQVGDELQVSAYVDLGDLEPADVCVQAVYGRVATEPSGSLDEDRLVDTSALELSPAEDLGEGRWRFAGSLLIDRSGAFGYSVRVLPRHELLASPAEMALVVNAG